MSYIGVVSLLFFSVVVTGLTVFLFRIKDRNNIKLLLAFSGSYLFAVSMLHLVPETYASGSSSIGMFVLAGFFLQILLEFFSEGIEHGHVHIHKTADRSFPASIIISLFIHSFLEGMPLASNIEETRAPLLTGIILHNIPIALALMAMLIESEVKKKYSIFILILFASAAPLGLYTSLIIGDNLVGNMSIYFDKIMAVVIGIFLHISTTILFESSDNHRFNLKKFATIIIGALIAILIS